MVKNEERYLLRALEFESVLRTWLYRYTRNNSAIEELLQETYARLLAAGRGKEPEIQSARAFALTTAREVASDWLRRRDVASTELVADPELADELHENPRSDEITNGHQELALLVNAVQGLPDRCRQAFTLRKVYGYSQKEIAGRLGISENTVEQHLTQAARRCAQALYDQPVDARPSSWFERMRRGMGLHADSN